MGGKREVPCVISSHRVWGLCRLDLRGRRSIGLRVGMGIRFPGGLGRSQGERLDPLSCVSSCVHDTIVS